MSGTTDSHTSREQGTAIMCHLLTLGAANLWQLLSRRKVERAQVFHQAHTNMGLNSNSATKLSTRPPHLSTKEFQLVTLGAGLDDVLLACTT